MWPTAKAATIITAALLLSGCRNADKSFDMQTTTMDTTRLTRDDWDVVRAHTVYFGHQSIGENVLDGLRAIAAQEGWPELRVVEGTTAPAGNPVLLHSKVGQNGDPISKITAFRNGLDAGAGARAEVALMKFCFWDVRADTDVTRVFAEYQNAVKSIGERFPALSLVHATVPLVVEDNDWRAQIRRLLGKPLPTDLDNSTRESLNVKIRAAYSERVFDIARAEEDRAARRGAVPYLSADFSSDGAHLNDAGRRHVAAEFVRSVAAAARVGAGR